MSATSVLSNVYSQAESRVREHQAAESTQQLQVLHLEDSFEDRAFIRRMLAEEGLLCEIVSTETKAQFEAALGQKRFDIILSDFSMPAYDGLSALAAASHAQPGVPFLFVSGTIGEERAVDGMRSGATDYVLKDRLGRLGPAIRRALKEALETARRKELEDQLRQAQKLEALGRLVGGVAHDFNNLLTIIGGNVELLLMLDGSLQDRSREWLKQVLSASERAGGLTRQLLAFGRKQPLQPHALNLNQTVEELLKMLGRVIGAEIRLDCQLSCLPVFVYADRGMMEQVLMNLVVNARDAMPDGGDLIIKTEQITLSEGFALSRHPEGRSGKFIRLSVADSGTGISPEHLPRIFEPFFTTKEIGKGTGLGLATVYGIVKQHQGWLEVSSVCGQGTVFQAYFPSISPPAAKPLDTLREPAVCGGDETILLVEDEPLLRKFAANVLEELGYRVFEANSGKAALQKWSETRQTVDLLLTDMVMPDGVTGNDLARRLRKVMPELRVILSSGYSRESLGDEVPGSKSITNAFLQKPYSPRTLARAVRQSLDAPLV
jgi:two-component system cell cycle sensor histidine kinase/response regulator CckA